MDINMYGTRAIFSVFWGRKYFIIKGPMVCYSTHGSEKPWIILSFDSGQENRHRWSSMKQNEKSHPWKTNKKTRTHPIFYIFIENSPAKLIISLRSFTAYLVFLPHIFWFKSLVQPLLLLVFSAYNRTAWTRTSVRLCR